MAAEDAVGAGQVVAHLEQLLLQGCDVVAGQQAAGVVAEDAVAEAPARAGQRRVGLDADDPVDRQAAPLLEVADRELGRGVVGCLDRRVEVRDQAEPGEDAPHFGDGITGGAAAEWLHRNEEPHEAIRPRRWTTDTVADSGPSVIVPQPRRHTEWGIKSASP